MRGSICSETSGLGGSSFGAGVNMPSPIFPNTCAAQVPKFLRHERESDSVKMSAILLATTIALWIESVKVTVSVRDLL